MIAQLSNRIMRFVLTAVFLLALAACGGGDEADSNTIAIGGIHDLTGPTSDVGTPYADGIRDYVDFVNTNGGIDGRQIDFMSADYAYAVDQAEQLYSQYVAEGVVAFQGWGTGDTEALRTRIAEDQIPFMSASYSAELANAEEAPYNFLVGTTYSDQFIIGIQYALDNSDSPPTIALVHNDSPFGLSPLEDGRAFAEANGVEVMAVPMPGGATDFTAQITQLQEVGVEYVVIQNVSSPAATFARDLERLDAGMQIICLNWCSDELFIELAGSAAEGAIAASPFAFPGSGADLIENEIRPYTESVDKNLDALGVHYVQGWTTMRTMVDAIRQVVADGNEVTGQNIKNALETYRDYSTGGVTDPLTYTAENHAGSDALQLYEVQDGTWVRISDYISAGE